VKVPGSGWQQRTKYLRRGGKGNMWGGGGHPKLGVRKEAPKGSQKESHKSQAKRSPKPKGRGPK